MITREGIEHFAAEIARRYAPEKIILFGSQASGTASEDSDVDMLVIMEYDGMRSRKSAEVKCSVQPDFSVDLLIRKPSEVKERLRIGDFFMQDILGEGEVLYDRLNQRVA